MAVGLSNKNKNRTIFKRLAQASVCVLALNTAAMAAELPTGENIRAGQAHISRSGKTLTVTQHSDKLAADWESFSIGKDHTVTFNQPSANAVALNRVLGPDVSVIQGALKANGRVFLVNPNGVTFTPSAEVSVGGLVASTLNITTEDFMAGNYRFEGSSPNAIINRGNIRADAGGTIALIAARIINDGTISAEKGNVLMGAGSKVTLDLGGPVKLEVERSLMDTLIEQGGAVSAGGGHVYLTARAASDLATSVINHTGLTEAQTLVTGEKGEIILLGDMQHGVTNVSGTLDASAPEQGDGGFIETSAATVSINEDVTITAGARHGKGGRWLVDPFNYTVNASEATTIANALNTGTDVTIDTVASNPAYGAGSAGNGDIAVLSAINKTAGGDSTLTLQAANTIFIDAPISSTSNRLNMLFDADNDGGVRNGGGAIIVNKSLDTNGGDLDFGTGAQLNINGTMTLVGGDVYVGGDGAPVEFNTGGGDLNLHGQLLIANTDGVEINTENGNADFYGIINSGNKYEKISVVNYTWDQAYNEAQNGTGGAGAEGDQYLATVTSRLENAVVVYTGGFVNGAGLQDGSWLGGRRVTGIGTNTTWRWVAGPEGEEDSGNGLPFSLGATSPSTPINGSFVNWQTGEPNSSGGEDRLQIGDDEGRWNDLTNNNIPLDIYIRETNFATASLTIDAGTGTTTFAEDVGGLKDINFTSYDVSNPNPNTPPAASVPSASSQTSTASQQSAVSTAQNTAIGSSFNSSPSYSSSSYQQSQIQQYLQMQNQSQSGNSTNSNTGNTQQGSGAGTAADGNGAASFSGQGGDGSNSGTDGPRHGTGTVGSLEIIEVSSKEGAGDNDDSGDSDIDVSGFQEQNGLLGPTKVFVVNGGVRLPAGASDNRQEQ